jgi:hypothetical protein
MRKALARLALCLALVVCVAGGTATSDAEAFVSNYSCTLKPVDQWCDGRANGTYDGIHSWDYNKGSYPGAWDGTVTMCQHIWKPLTGYEHPGKSCGLNVTANYYGNITCICYEAEVKQLSGGPHSVNGYADASF